MSKQFMWLSFADADLPEGKQFLGGGIFEGGDIIAATLRTHRLGVNPGGEVMSAGPLRESDLPAGWPIEKLLTKKEIGKLEKEAKNGTNR
jgi:hypothetical protein